MQLFDQAVSARESKAAHRMRDELAERGKAGEHYDDLLRLAGSLKFGHATASLLVGKLSASGRQNARNRDEADRSLFVVAGNQQYSLRHYSWLEPLRPRRER